MKIVNILANLIKEPLFSVTITLCLYVVFQRMYNRHHLFFLNPLLIIPVIIIPFILMTYKSYDIYYQGAKGISFFLGPATVALALPLYRQLPVLKTNLISIITGVIVGSCTGIVSVVLIAKFLGASTKTLLSLAPKSTTTPIALGISDQLGGISSLTVMGVMFAGIFGGVAAPEILKLFRVKNKVAFGIAIGTSSHAGGTSRAVQIGETEGSMSGVAIVLTGLATAIIIQLILKIFL